MQGTARVLQKLPVIVEISLADGSTLHGKLFVTPQSRVIDALNDERNFLPVEDMEGAVVALAKSAIKQVTLPAVAVPAYRGRDPYMVLGVSEGVSPEKLKQVYRQLSLDNHPDRIKGLGLGPDFVELATQNMMRINSAYVHIVRSMKGGDRKGFGAHKSERAG